MYSAAPLLACWCWHSPSLSRLPDTQNGISQGSGDSKNEDNNFKDSDTRRGKEIDCVRLVVLFFKFTYFYIIFYQPRSIGDRRIKARSFRDYFSL